jgi:type VI secretion system protein ImpA
MDRLPFSPDIEALLTPFAGAQPAGRSMRYEPVYSAIRHAREEEDPNLPMGVWERPLKKADWPQVEAKCLETLQSHSKDFQVAAWLCEAWIHLHQVEGLVAGASLLAGLVERFWDCAHPQIEDGDDDARAAPFVWINENLPVALTLHIALLKVPERVPSVVTLAVWDQAVAGDPNKAIVAAKAGDPLAEKPLTRDDMNANGAGRSLPALLAMRGRLQTAADQWDGLAQMVDARMGVNAPSIARVGETLRRLERAARSLTGGHEPADPAAPSTQASTDEAANAHPDEINWSPSMESAPPQQADVPADHAPIARSGAIANRDEAYRLLEEVAAYLQKTEPHSPTPYLIKRAVAWGHMSLADLMQEVVREEGDITRFFSLLGIKGSHE